MDAIVSPGGRCLTGTPWSVRLGRAIEGRPALEMYEAETLIDVVVATPIAPEILRGARRGVCRGQPSAIAWGRLPPDSAAPMVLFTQGRRNGGGHVTEVIIVGEFCWLAVSRGRFTGVTVSHPGTQDVHRRTRKGRRW